MITHAWQRLVPRGHQSTADSAESRTVPTCGTPNATTGHKASRTFNPKRVGSSPTGPTQQPQGLSPVSASFAHWHFGVRCRIRCRMPTPGPSVKPTPTKRHPPIYAVVSRGHCIAVMGGSGRFGSVGSLDRVCVHDDVLLVAPCGLVEVAAASDQHECLGTAKADRRSGGAPTPHRRAEPEVLPRPEAPRSARCPRGYPCRRPLVPPQW
jgi:hypothetical protein